MESTVRAALSPKLDAPPPPPAPSPRRSLTAVENLSVGATAGAIEITIQQPTIALKNAMQTGAPLPRSIPAFYRGLGVNVASIAPITAVQFSLTAALTAAVLSRRPALPAWLYEPNAPVPEPTGPAASVAAAGDHRASLHPVPTEESAAPPRVAVASDAIEAVEAAADALAAATPDPTDGGDRLSPAAAAAVAATAGAASAVLTAPAEHMIVVQQAKALSLPAAARALAASAAVRGVTHPWRGFWATAGRDALYTAAYMGVAGSGAGLGVLGGIGVGVAVGVATHPLDTIKTRMQGDVPGGWWRGGGGVSGLMKGVVPRAGRIGGAVAILGGVKGVLEDLVIDFRG
ncbi:hypothetical protein MMPV_002691 [Pyropia vietnamensis]